MRVRQALELALDRVDDSPIGMSQARHRGAAARIQVTLAGRIDDVHPIAAYRQWIILTEAAVEDVSHLAEFSPGKARQQLDHGRAIRSLSRSRSRSALQVEMQCLAA